MRFLSILICTIMLGSSLIAQYTSPRVPSIQWQRCLGGSGADFIDDNAPNIYSSEQKPLITTADGGYLLGGSVQSNDGDVSGNHGGADIWLVRLDRLGNTIWKKTYGGTANEFIGGIMETADHNFVVAGSSNSNNGDVSGNHGTYDAWVFEIDGNGNLLWQKSVGGSGTDKAYNLSIGADKSISVVGLTRSSNGDVSGLHIGTDSVDAWVFKLNPTGALLWQKCLGGSAKDEGISIDATSDAGLIVAANAESSDGNVSGNHGLGDIWIVKLDAGGSMVWQRCLGGTRKEFVGRVKKTADNGFIIAGMSESANGDVNFQPDQVYEEIADGWIIKMDIAGNLVWNKCYGEPSREETLYDITELPSGDLIMSGFASIAGGSAYGNGDDALVAQLSPTGTIRWMEAYGSFGSEGGHTIVKSPDEGFLMLASTSNSQLFQGPRYYSHVKGSHGNASDLWVVKLVLANSIKGLAYLDKNLNGTKDSGEPVVVGGLVKSVKNGDETNSVSNNAGSFMNIVDTGSYTTTIQYNSNFVSVPASKLSTFKNYNTSDSFSFALQPVPGRRDLAIAAIPSNTARPGFDMSVRIYYKNNGTDTIANGEVLFKKDPRYTFISAVPANSSSNGDTLKWSYTNLGPLEAGSIVVKLKVQAPPAVNLNDTLSSLAIITPVTGDLMPSDDTAYLNQHVQGSYDPNDKSENLAGKISKREISSNSYINYVIRFQNTGTDTAFNVAVRDTLDDKLDWGSLQMVAASHSYQLNIKSQNQLTWSFNNIKLVDSFRNEPASHGFIAYRIRPKSSLVIGDIIKNTASIYFDYNLPVETNTQETEVVQYSINNPQVGIPTVSSFTPASAASGATVSITGTNLTGATAVSFGSVAAISFTVNSATSITAVVGTGASGNVSVTTAGGTATLAGFTFIPSPTITSFTPASGANGASITITGTNFTGATAVSFGGTAATSFTVNSATSITAVVGSGASGDVSVITAGGTTALAGFTFIPLPAITSFTPTSGGTAASITITGTNFTGATAVSFGGTAATSFTVSSPTSITAVIGAGASGNVSVTTPGGTASLAGFTFTVVTAIDPVPASALGIRFYPNPTTGSFVIDTLRLTDKWETLEIFDTQGKKKLSNFMIRNKTRVNVSVEYLSNGLYVAILKRKSGPPAVFKFLKL